MTDDPGPLVAVDGVVLDHLWDRAADGPWAVAVVTHPHPLMGGDMRNPVPAGLARALSAAGVDVLRFDFRGTGESGGSHDDGFGEQHDVDAAIVRAAAAGLPVVGVGYSFGADVLLACDPSALAAVVAVAPPFRILHVGDLRDHRGTPATLVLSPAHDQFCGPDRARSITQDWPATTVEAVEGADHFLAGAVQRVADRVVAQARSALGGS